MIRSITSVIESKWGFQPYYLITFGDGTAYLQRLGVMRATESPLTAQEDTIISLCKKIQDLSANSGATT